MKRKEILKAMKAMKSEKPINSMYRMIPKSRMDEFKRFVAIFGFTEENIENILNFAFENSSRLLQAYHTFNYHPFISVKAVG